MEHAIEATELRKSYSPEVVALDGLSLTVAAGTIFGLLGPNGAGKSTTVTRALTRSCVPTAAARASRAWMCSQTQSACGRMIGVVGQKHGSDPEATGRENLILQGEFYGIARTRAQGAGRGLARALRAERRRRAPGEDLLGGYGSDAWTSPWASCTGPACCSWTSPRPASTPRHGSQMWQRDRAPGRRGADDDHADDALHGGGRQARLAARHHRARAGRHRGHTRGAQERARGRHDPGGARPAAQDGVARSAIERLADIEEVALDGQHPARAKARDGSAAIPAVLAALESRGIKRQLGDARAPIARRGLPAPCRTRLPGGGARARGGRGMSAVQQTWQVYLRNIRFLRAPARHTSG